MTVHAEAYRRQDKEIKERLLVFGPTSRGMTSKKETISKYRRGPLYYKDLTTLLRESLILVPSYPNYG